MDYLAYIIPILIIILVVFGIPLLKKYNILTEENGVYIDKAFMIAELIIRVTKLDSLVKDQIIFALDIADTVVNYIEELGDQIDPQAKKATAKEFTSEMYKRLGIEPTPDEWKLINIVIDESLGSFAK